MRIEPRSQFVAFGPPLLIVALASPVLFLGLGRYGLVNGDEGIYHYMARHMVESGNWFELWFTGEPRIYDTLTHAPLYLWGKAAIILALGDSYATMRLLSASCGLLTLLALYSLLVRVAGRRAALLAALIQLTTFDFIYLHSARTGEMETSLTLAFTLAALFFLRSVETGRSFVPHHLCLVALLNLKLAIVAIPLVAEAAFFVLYPPARARFRAWLVTAIWLLPLGMAWHWGQLIAHRGALPEVIATMERASRGGGFYPDPGLWHHVRFYAGRLAAGTFPYALLHPLAVAGVLLGARDAQERSRWILLALYPAAVIAYFLSLSIYQPWYLVPTLPFLSAFLGTWLDRLLDCPPGRWACGGLAVALAVGAWVRLPIVSVNPYADRAMASRPDLYWGELAGLGPALGIPLLAGVLALVIAILVRAQRQRALGIALIATFFLVGGVRIATPIQHLPHSSKSERLSRALEAALSEGRPIDYPVYVRQPGLYKARYYFGDDFDLRQAGRALRQQGVFFVLYEGKDPPVTRFAP